MNDWDIKEALELDTAITTTPICAFPAQQGDAIQSNLLCLITTDGRLFIADRLNRKLQPWIMNDE